MAEGVKGGLGDALEEETRGVVGMFCGEGPFLGALAAAGAVVAGNDT